MQSDSTFEVLETRNLALPRRSESSIGSYRESETLEFIQDCLKASANPVCLCSFGKDSLVLLHLILRLKKVPVIYWREPFFQKKFAHPQKVAEDWDLAVYDYPPSACDYMQLDDYFDVYSLYSAGKSWLNLYTGCVDYQEGKPFLCAIKDLLLRPKVSSYEFKWDCVFHGHKQCDPVYIADKIDLPRTKYDGEKILVLPIRDWTDQDIWDYIHKYNLPYNSDRYDSKNEDKNNDMFRTCHNCLDYRVKEPYCPLVKKSISSVAKSKEDNIRYRDTLLGRAYK